MKINLFILILVLYSCQKENNRIQSNETLDYHNFINDPKVEISQIEGLYKMDFIFDKLYFNVTKDSSFKLKYEAKGDLFNVIFDKCFLKYYNDDDLDMSDFKKTTKIHYLGKFQESKLFRSQIFLLKTLDPIGNFYLDELIILNSKNNFVLSIATLSENFCSEECIGKISNRKRNNIYKIETTSYIIDPDKYTEDYFTFFKFNNDGYVEFIQD